MKPKTLKYILDIEAVISEIEEIKHQLNNDFTNFEFNFMAQRAIERELEIIGEAMNKISKIDSEVNISGIPNIISLRNLIIHAYDSVDPELIWAIIQRDIPKLRDEIALIRKA